MRAVRPTDHVRELRHVRVVVAGDLAAQHRRQHHLRARLRQRRRHHRQGVHRAGRRPQALAVRAGPHRAVGGFGNCYSGLARILLTQQLMMHASLSFLPAQCLPVQACRLRSTQQPASASSLGRGGFRVREPHVLCDNGDVHANAKMG